jgi:hypothetical protein
VDGTGRAVLAVQLRAARIFNLEASVRSRDARHRTAGSGRDLIEAGLN